MWFELNTRNEMLAEELKNSAPPGVVVEVRYMMTRSANDPGWIVVALEFVRDKSIELDLALIAAWLYDKSKKDKSCHIDHGGKKVIKSKAGIRRGIDENLQIGKND
jgi:hypothetical protein